VYRDHLPLLGQHQHQQQNDQNSQGVLSLNHLQNHLQYQQLEIGDRVRKVIVTILFSCFFQWYLV